MIRQYLPEIVNNRTSWIQNLSKDELLTLFEELKISSENLNIDALRKKLRELVKTEKLLSYIPDEILEEKMTLPYYGRIEPFDGTNFELFEQKLECVITLHDIPKTKQTPLLLTNLTTKVFETLNHLCTPDKPINKDYSELIKLLEKRYTKSTSTPLDRAVFRARNQKQNEKIEDYIIELKKLARKCEYKDIDEQVKEKFIDGVCKPLIKFELLKNGETSLEKLITIARTVETAMQQSNIGDQESMEPAQVTSSKEMFQHEKKSSVSSSKAFTKPVQNQHSFSNKQSVVCFVCGKNNHTRSECSLKNKFCSECGKQGHIFRVCRMRMRQTKTLEAVEENNTEIEEDIQNLFVCEEDSANVYSMYANNLSENKIPPQFLNMFVEGKAVKFEMDTGSEVSTLTLNDQLKLFPDKKVEKCNIIFKNFDQSTSKPVGIVKSLNVSWNGLLRQVEVYIVHNDKPRIIGRNWLKSFEQWPLKLNKVMREMKVNEMCNPVDMIKNKFKEVFTPGWGDFKGEHITLKLKNEAKPKFLPVRQIPFALKEKVKSEINRLLLNKRIEPVKYSEWGTPVVPVLKSDGSVRLCGDYKVTLNPYLETDHYPLPHIEDILQTLRGGEYYCELDLKEAYLQAPLDPSSQELTVINTEFGIFKYLYLPYGVSTGPGSFQRLMSKKLSFIPNTIVFIDNIYIKGSSQNDMCNNLEMVLNILNESGLRLKVEKCKFFRKSIDVFGYNISKEGISIIKSNIKPILDLAPPESITMLRSFLGKINYYSRFLKDMATIMAPLYELTKKSKFEWTKKCQNSFELIKRKLASAQALKHYDPSLPLILTCDASEIGLSAILSTCDTDNVIKPVAFASKKLNGRERKYSTLDKEAMAIIFGVTKFYNYIYGRSFTLETDNAALVRIFGPDKGIPKMAAKRLQHYAIFLSAFSYKIKHILTDKNPADYLSRLPIDDTNNKINLEVCTNYIESSDIDIINWEVIQKETCKDVLLSQVIRYSYDGWPDIKLIEEDLKPYYIKRNEISIDRNCLFWGHRIIIPSKVRNDVLHELHKSHFGGNRMIDIAKSYFWWPKLNEEITELTKECVNCLSYRNNPPKTALKMWPVPPSPWYRIHADYLGPLFGKMFLVVVDSFSKWPEVFQMANIGSGLTIQKFKDMFLRFGFPIHLVTDNGTSFTSNDFQNFCKAINMKHSFTPVKHPATNGAAERFVETFKNNITKIVDSGKSLNYAIGIFLSDYRVTPHKSTGISPARLMLGREIRNRFSLLRPTPIYHDLLVKQRRVEETHNGHRNVLFKVGQKVTTKDFRKGHKPWAVGTIVEESIPGITYFIDVGGLKWKRHVSQINECSQSVF